MAEANGTNGATQNGTQNQRSPDELRRLEELVANTLMGRSEMFGQWFGSRVDVFKECSYPDVVQAEYFRNLYDRMSIAARVVQLLPKESWQVSPRVYEKEESKKPTPFEEAFDNVGRSIQPGKSWHASQEGSLLWTYLNRIDVLSGIGVFGVLLFGIDDGKLLQEPAEGVPPDGAPLDISGISGAGVKGADLTSKDIYGGQLPKAVEVPLSSTMGTDAQYFGVQFSPMQPPGSGKGKQRKLLFLRCFDESLVQVVQYEASMYSPRFGQPLMYLVTLNDPRQPHTGVGLPLATVRVHWSRLLHVADNLDNSEIFGVPRQRPVLNNILDLQKLYGSSAQGYWNSAFPGLSIETHPQLGGDVIVDRPALRGMMNDYYSNLQRALFLMGMTAKSLAPVASDPSPQIASQIEAICIYLGCPVRVFKGSERGELASSQDDSKWNDILRHRQQFYLTPRLIVPFIDRLIQLGVLPEPGEPYHIEWPDLESLSDSTKATIALTETQALLAYVSGNVSSVYPEKHYLVDILGKDEEHVDEILKEAEASQQSDDQEDQDTADQHGYVPAPPDGYKAPEPPPDQGAGGQPAGQLPGQSPVGSPSKGQMVDLGKFKSAQKADADKRQAAQPAKAKKSGGDMVDLSEFK